MMCTSTDITADFFLNAEGMAPNSYRSTMRALSFVEGRTRLEKIADVGCGTGLQTVALYEATQRQIVAVDFVTEFVEYMKQELYRQKLMEYISPVLASPGGLPFEEEELDLLWSEYAAGKYGFEYTLREWSRFVRKDGYMVVCSYCWLADNPPEMVTDYWKANDKEIETIDCRVKQFVKSGFLPVAHFVMPDECWWNYFCPLEENFKSFIDKYPGNQEAEQLIDKIDKEISFYEKYSEYYGYVFFIGRKLR